MYSYHRTVKVHIIIICLSYSTHHCQRASMNIMVIIIIDAAMMHLSCCCCYNAEGRQNKLHIEI